MSQEWEIPPAVLAELCNLEGWGAVTEARCSKWEEGVAAGHVVGRLVVEARENETVIRAARELSGFECSGLTDPSKARQILQHSVTGFRRRLPFGILTGLGESVLRDCIENAPWDMEYRSGRIQAMHEGILFSMIIVLHVEPYPL